MLTGGGALGPVPTRRGRDFTVLRTIQTTLEDTGANMMMLVTTSSWVGLLAFYYNNNFIIIIINKESLRFSWNLNVLSRFWKMDLSRVGCYRTFPTCLHWIHLLILHSIWILLINCPTAGRWLGLAVRLRLALVTGYILILCDQHSGKLQDP